MYTSLLQKKQSELFEYSREQSLKSLVLRLESLSANGYCFRGQRNALWEIVSSAQRAWNGWRCRHCVSGSVGYQRYLSMSLEYAKGNVSFPECGLKCRKAGLRDHERWGYLQHYSWPTPFIDFSNDFKVALFMAVRSVRGDAPDGWFSIYAIRPVFAGGEENIDLDEFIESECGAEILEELYEFQRWQSKDTFVMRKDAAHWCPAVSGGRMASQGGLFVYLRSDHKSLEEVFAQRYKMDVGESDFATEEHDRIVCIDVPYSIVKDVKAYLMDEKVDAHVLGLADDSVDNGMKARYKRFSMEFLQHCNVLKLKVRLGENTFVRSYGDDALFWNGRTGASRQISSGAALCESICGHPQEWGSVASEIAKRLQCPFAVAEKDYWPIVNDLAKDSLVEIDGRKPQAVSGEKSGEDAAEEVQGENEKDVDFFKKNRLPAELHVDLTSACTERCVHCYLPGYPSQFLEFELLDKALVDFRRARGLTVFLTGGESMMHPDFARICRRCRDLYLNFVVMSNLTLCDEKMVSVLKETNPQYVNVSLYSMDAAEHDAITRRNGSWQETMGAILACEKAGVHVRLAAPLLKENRNAFARLKAFADEHRMHLVTDCCIVPRCDHSADNIDHACSSEELERALSENKNVFDRDWRERPAPPPDAKVCEIGDTRLCLNSRGEYYPCDGMHGHVLGDVRTQRLLDVWRGEKMDRLRSLKNRDFKKCSSCEHRSFCKVCPAYNFNATGTLTETIPAQCELARVVHKVYGGR